MAQGYLAMLEGSPEVFGGLVRHVAHADHHPVVFHCTAGKDRTGLGAALLLGAVGVADDVIVEDYRLTDDFRSVHRLAEIAPQLEEQGLALDDLKVLFTSPAETMELTLAALDERWGGIEGYLTGPAGVSRQTLDDLAEALVE
jgi:protein-tyrosine phosphatase